MPLRAVVAVVEDDTSSRKTLLRVLRAGGFDAREYTSAEHYLASPPRPSPVGLLLDMSGAQRRCRAVLHTTILLCASNHASDGSPALRVQNTSSSLMLEFG